MAQHDHVGRSRIFQADGADAGDVSYSITFEGDKLVSGRVSSGALVAAAPAVPETLVNAELDRPLYLRLEDGRWVALADRERCRRARPQRWHRSSAAVGRLHLVRPSHPSLLRAPGRDARFRSSPSRFPRRAGRVRVVGGVRVFAAGALSTSDV